jgi:3-dehydroquinate dehydratase
VLLLIASVAMSIWANVEVLQFLIVAAAGAYLHLPEAVGVNSACEQLSLRQGECHLTVITRRLDNSHSSLK